MKIFRVSFSERVNIIKRTYSSIRKFKSNKLKTLDKLYFKQDVHCQQNISFSCLYTPKKNTHLKIIIFLKKMWKILK